MKVRSKKGVRGGKEMQGGKAQADIVSAVIIVIIALGLVSTAYMWGLPLIEKQQSKAVVERLYNYFDRNQANSLPRLIEDVANNGGERTFASTIDGLWMLKPYDCIVPTDCKEDEKNSIQFTAATKVSNIGVNMGWIGAGCPAAGSAPSIGIVGTDDASVVCGRADSTGVGYNITYRIWFRELDESSVKGYKINLVKQTGGPLTSSGKTVRITRGTPYTDTTSQPGKTLIITEVKILLG